MRRFNFPKKKKYSYDDLKELVYSYKTDSKYGFTNSEMRELIDMFPNINMEKFNNAMMGNTCMSNERGEIINYHCDVLTALSCGIEDRDQHWYEFD